MESSGRSWMKMEAKSSDLRVFQQEDVNRIIGMRMIEKGSVTRVGSLPCLPEMGIFPILREIVLRPNKSFQKRRAKKTMKIDTFSIFIEEKMCHLGPTDKFFESIALKFFT